VRKYFLVALICFFSSDVLVAQDHPKEVSQSPQSHATHKVKPQLATGVAISPDGQLWIVGLNERSQLFVQKSTLGKLGEWAEAKELDTAGDAISADGENRPKIAFGPNGWVVISYTQPLAKPYTGFIRMLRSTDGGKTFSAPFTVHQDRQEITHRFESIALDDKGDLHTLWVDKRDQPPRNSGKSYVGAAIYRNVSRDGGATFEPDTKVADHSCECCRIALAQNSAGELQAIWRHVFGEQTRDHAFSSVVNKRPNDITRASYDDWQINACPHHGPGLALNASDTKGGYHTVWFGLRQEKDQMVGAVRYARLSASGAPLPDSLVKLPDPRAEHADVMSYKERVAVVWRSSEGNKTSLKAWLSGDGGKTFELKNLGDTLGYNDHPRLAQHGSRMVVVWRLPEEIKTYEISF
jgi:hypothetical protein